MSNIQISKNYVCSCMIIMHGEKFWKDEQKTVGRGYFLEWKRVLEAVCQGVLYVCVRFFFKLGFDF